MLGEMRCDWTTADGRAPCSDLRVCGEIREQSATDTCVVCARDFCGSYLWCVCARA